MAGFRALGPPRGLLPTWTLRLWAPKLDPSNISGNTGVGGLGRDDDAIWFVSAAYIAWFVRVRLFTAGPAVEKKEWLQAIGSIVILMLGTINVRLAAMRARSRDGARR
jgi:hypothetical protein